MRFPLFTALAALSVSSVPAPSQNFSAPPTSSGAVLSQPIAPVPDDGKIVIYFGQSTRLYFKRPIKSVHVGDELAVSVVPLSEHILSIKGISPGQTNITMESTDGSTQALATIVTVVSEPHEVRVYQREQVNAHTGERRSDSSSNIGGYVSMRCNQIRCEEPEPEQQSRLPK